MPRASRRLVAAAAAAVLAGCAAAAPADPGESGPGPAAAGTPASHGSVWVANEGGDSITVLDAASGATRATLTGIAEPHNVQAAAAADVVWAVSANDQVVALSGDTLEVTAVGTTDAHPAHVVGDAAGRVYVTSSGQPSVYAYDQRLRPLRRTALSGSPHGMRLDADGRTAVVANTGEGTVDVIDTASGAVAARIPVGPQPVQVAVTDDGAVAYVSLAGTSEVARVDLDAATVTHRVPVPHPPAQVLLTAGGLLLSADQGTAAAPGRTVTVLDAKTMTVRAEVEVGAGPHGLTSDPAGHRAWVTNAFDDSVTELDLQAMAAVRTVPVGKQPGGISFGTGVPARGGERALDVPAREDRGAGHAHDH